MSDISPTENLWEVQDLPGQLTLELHAGKDLALVLAQGGGTIRIELAHVRPVIAGNLCILLRSIKGR